MRVVQFLLSIMYVLLKMYYHTNIVLEGDARSCPSAPDKHRAQKHTMLSLLVYANLLALIGC